MATKKQTYDEALKEIEEILDQIENEQFSVDELAGKVKKASELIKFCKSKLHDTEEEIEKILDNLDTNGKMED